jgi:hypothetical protein
MINALLSRGWRVWRHLLCSRAAWNAFLVRLDNRHFVDAANLLTAMEVVCNMYDETALEPVDNVIGTIDKVRTLNTRYWRNSVYFLCRCSSKCVRQKHHMPSHIKTFSEWAPVRVLTKRSRGGDVIRCSRANGCVKRSSHLRVCFT